MDNKLYEKLSIVNVKNKLNLTEGYCRGNSIYVYCPFCRAEDRDKANLKLNTENDSYYCNYCGENGYAVGMYAKLNYITNKKAFKELLSKEADMRTSMQFVKKASKRNETEISMVYEYLLKMLGLSKKHCHILMEYGFSKDDIIKNSFKSVPQNESEKIKICSRLIKCGFELSGVPGFFMNRQMKWTFKSHKGFFIPVTQKECIKGLRIHLEENYKLNTSDIWFSSGSEYKGSSPENSIMIFYPENVNKIELFNSNIESKKDVIITTEFLLGYRLFERDKKITIAIPNRISKRQGHMILNSLNIDKVDVYIDKHTLTYDYLPVYKNLLNYIKDEKKSFNYVFDFKELVNKENNVSISNAA